MQKPIIKMHLKLPKLLIQLYPSYKLVCYADKSLSFEVFSPPFSFLHFSVSPFLYLFGFASCLKKLLIR